ncbi:TonB-dependent receptor plug domain-containing protein [Thiopseudomonas acetoxidans]|uniref:TonB-dependent receptor n=1 Tax=Thiopseudomonas acetoxidans TaxID=3041622 RepID=A0ABT7SLW9_9GAMM|nr:TonB-dependent receptor [Thiopseudomonas sp. CY1220]MDM7857184.1 TonB-dependent receptor [Thiopseudomonas sp. CY1220]
MLISKTPLAVAATLFAVGGLGVTSAAWAASDSFQLPVMVVSATGYQQEVLRAPASITVVEHDQIQRKPVADLAEVLRDIPGVDIVDSGVAGMKRISLRGESSRRVLIKVNGQPIPDHSSYGSPLLLDANIIERIEVVRGSASVVHGSNAIGGVVNITTRQAAPGEQEAFVGAGYYSATRGQRLNGGVLGATDRFDWRLQLSKADFGDRRIPRGQVKGSTDQTKYSRLKPSDSEQKSVSAELGWRLDERQRIAWQGDYFRQEAAAWLPQQPNMIMGLEFPKRDSLRNALSYSFADEDVLFHSVEGRVYHQKGKRVMDNTINILDMPVPKTPFVVSSDSFNRSHDKLTTQGLQLTASSRLLGDNNTVFGFEHQKDKLDTEKKGVKNLIKGPPGTQLGKTYPSSSQYSEQTLWSAFVQQQFYLNDSLEANLGARYYSIDSKLKKSTERSTTSKTDEQLVGSAALVWQYDERSSVRSSIAQGYTYPSLTQQFSATPGNGAMNYGNPNLKAEKATTYELGWRFEDRQWAADVTLYHSQARNFIDKARIAGVAQGYTTACKDVCFQWLNTNRAQTTGAELMLAYQLENWRPYLNMGIQKRRLEYGTGLKTWDSGLPKFQGRAGVEWYATEQLELDFYVRGGGKSRRDDYDSKGEPQRQRTSSYAELNVGAYYKPVPNLSLAVLAQNLADRRYRNPDELQAAGRALDMEVRWSF